MNAAVEQRLQQELEQFREDGVYKKFNYIASPQDTVVQMEGRGEIIVLSSNNYLGLSNHPDVVRAGTGVNTIDVACATANVEPTTNGLSVYQ